MRAASERSKPESSNGLKGIRFTLLGTVASRFTSSRACSGESFTPSSITYSKVMKSRGATSR